VAELCPFALRLAVVLVAGNPRSSQLLPIHPRDSLPQLLETPPDSFVSIHLSCPPPSLYPPLLPSSVPPSTAGDSYSSFLRLPRRRCCLGVQTVRSPMPGKGRSLKPVRGRPVLYTFSLYHHGRFRHPPRTRNSLATSITQAPTPDHRPTCRDRPIRSGHSPKRRQKMGCMRTEDTQAAQLHSYTPGPGPVNVNFLRFDGPLRISPTERTTEPCVGQIKAKSKR
jgi:hypothetical protein